MKLFIATIGLTLGVMTSAEEAKSIKYTASGSQILEVNTVKFSDRAVQHTKTYRYRVYAESNAGPSDFSNIAEITVP